MKYTIRKSVVHVLGYIWQPGCGPCGLQMDLNDYQIGCMRVSEDGIVPVDVGPITRDSVQSWLDTHAGDFSSIIDFYANVENGDETVEIEWSNVDNESTFWDCVNGPEEREMD